MPDQLPAKLTCPRCGNVNAYAAESCLNCNLPLASIRAALEGASPLAAPPPLSERPPDPAESPAPPAQPREPAPPLPKLEARPAGEEIGTLVDSKRFLVRGIGDRAEEIAARFFGRLALRGIENVRLTTGTLAIRNQEGAEDTRPYYFAEHDLSNDGALAIMAVRLAPVGDAHGDLFVEWLHYVLGSAAEQRGACHLAIVLGTPIVALFGALAFAALVVPRRESWTPAMLIAVTVICVIGFIIFMIFPKDPYRKNLEGFQSQDSIAFQGAVRAALEEAVDHAGIARSQIQGFGDDDGGPRRII